MDSYLALAEEVLSDQKRAMSALEILRIAYRDGLAPGHIRGRTQHKTLQARLSEDILRYREGSKFYRTEPGKFFLHAMKNHPDVPESDRTPIVARRRTRSLPKRHILTLRKDDVVAYSDKGGQLSPIMFERLITSGHYSYIRDAKSYQDDDVLVWTFAVVLKGCSILSYRAGPYKEQRDGFMSRRVLGFYSPVSEDDITLFDQADHGVLWSGIKSLATDLDLHGNVEWQALYQNTRLTTIVSTSGGQAEHFLLAVTAFACPNWLEPTSSRLAINDLQWIDLRSPINYVEDFDPWSQTLLPIVRQLALS